MSESVRCLWMRGGTSKGAYFLDDELPAERDRFLLRIMGSPDPRQIDGIGGADPLTSKVAIVKASSRPGIDVDYLFLQVSVDEPLVSAAQNCGNILAGVGPFAIERGLVAATSELTEVSIYMENTGQIAVARVPVKNALPDYSGQSSIDGVPGTASAIALEFKDTAGSSCGALLPTGNVIDEIDGFNVTMIDNGMPVVVLRADDMGITGQESREALEADTQLKARLESIRLTCGPLMNLEDVSQKTVPKMTMVSPALNGGAISTRTFIPHRCHASIGVLGAVSVATAGLLPGSVAADIVSIPDGNTKHMMIEHPIGNTAIEARMNQDGTVGSTAIIRTARKLFDGTVFT
ncbi:MAG: 4-oxalomesaconate tautomerase [Granulosicoccus sp.]